jgi:hypothetical protein
MSFQLTVPPAADRFSRLKLNAAQTIQKQTWEKEGYKIAENQAAIPKGAEQRTFSVPGRVNELARSRGLPQATFGDQSFLFYKGGAEEEKAAAPAAAPAAAAAPAQPVPQTVPGNPQLSIPGIDVRLTGEQIGIKPAESTQRKARGVSTGTNKLTIPRSSGASGLNIG